MTEPESEHGHSHDRALVSDGGVLADQPQSVFTRRRLRGYTQDVLTVFDYYGLTDEDDSDDGIPRDHAADVLVDQLHDWYDADDLDVDAETFGDAIEQIHATITDQRQDTEIGAGAGAGDGIPDGMTAEQYFERQYLTQFGRNPKYDYDDTPGATVEATTTPQILRALIEIGLTPPQTLDFWATEFCGWTQADWSEARDCNPSVVSRHVSEARDLIGTSNVDVEFPTDRGDQPCDDAISVLIGDMVARGISPAAVIDGVFVRVLGHSQGSWGDIRGRTQSSVSGNISNIPDWLTEKMDGIGDRYSV